MFFAIIETQYFFVGYILDLLASCSTVYRKLSLVEFKFIVGEHWKAQTVDKDGKSLVEVLV